MSGQEGRDETELAQALFRTLFDAGASFHSSTVIPALTATVRALGYRKHPEPEAELTDHIRLRGKQQPAAFELLRQLRTVAGARRTGDPGSRGCHEARTAHGHLWPVGADRMTTPDMPRIRQDHALAVERIVTRLRQKHRPSGGYVLYDRRTRDAIHEGIEYTLTLQHAWDELPQDEAIAELGKKAGSIYWPIISDDPRFWGVCERCRKKILIDATGVCEHCGEDLAN